MTVELFEEVWPYIDSVYTKLRSESLQGTVRVQTYEYRPRKSKKSQTTREATSASDSKVIKRRCSGGSIRDSYLCNVRIKVSCFVDGSAVVVERIDEHLHTLDLEESFQIKKPSILTGYIKSEVVKNYSAAQIFHAL